MPTFLGNFCKGDKTFNFSSEIIFGQPLIDIWRFFLVTLVIAEALATTTTTYCYHKHDFPVDFLPQKGWMTLTFYVLDPKIIAKSLNEIKRNFFVFIVRVVTAFHGTRERLPTCDYQWPIL